MTTNTRQLFLAYHVRAIDVATSRMQAGSWCERWKLQRTIDQHRAAIQRLDRECQAEDRTNFPASGKWSDQFVDAKRCTNA